MRSNVILMSQKWLFAATLLFVTAVSNAQSVQFFDESAGGFDHANFDVQIATAMVVY